MGSNISVCYGMRGNNLPLPDQVVDLCKQHNIRRIRLYDPYPPALDALSGSGIQLTLDVPNVDLPRVAASQPAADSWVRDNVAKYPGIEFRYLTVGNEVSPLRHSEFAPFVLPAMQNILNAVKSFGLDSKIRVSTAIEAQVLANPFPPTDAEFKPEVASFIEPVVKFLVENGGPFLANLYPYFAYASDKNIPLDYALFESSEGVVAGGVRYPSLFAASLDAFYAALGKSGGSSLEIVVTETGWPSGGGDEATSVENAGTYNRNLVRRVGEGTPSRPGRTIEAYIFALFDENEKDPPETEKHFGIFTAPEIQLKYEIEF
ncbi:glucan endo-1 3-beta-glucosidas [Striga asiatica]|uniref:Glucan endo-1 3-beta-glucosidas n=1 Tax=Striga asiatica TaxID=4170 RepID=A0A5A7PY93_STRAF|nr:glucan endo-1 3-beta-glucosidas [Striga asiatica]